MRCAVVLAAMAAAAACSLDPVHDDAVKDLGLETTGVPRGPLHRPNQPCLVCHGGSGPASTVFTSAGTVYSLPTSLVPLASATVSLVDAQGLAIAVTTNEAGTFYVARTSWDPSGPVHVTVSLGDVTTEMSTVVGRDGSCASCHVDPATRISAGHVFLAPNAALLPGADGGAP